MVLELDTGRCANEDAVPRKGVDTRRCVSKDAGEGGGFGESPTSIGEMNECQRGCWALKEGGLRDPTLVWEENETLFIRVWKPIRRVLKILKGSTKGKSQKGQYLLAVH